MVGSDYVGGLEYSTPAGIRYLWGSVDRPTAGGHVGRGLEYSILAGIASFCSPEYSILAGIAYFSGPGVYHFVSGPEYSILAWIAYVWDLGN